MDIYILKYNNYYNRILKKADTIAEYGEPVYVLQDVRDFNPGDGVNTSHLFGSPTLNYNGTGDYAIVVEDSNIISRWFILDVTFTRQGQWALNFRRDLLVDFYVDWIDTDCFIEKATLGTDDDLMFNEEDMTFNQIKTSEILLKDNTQCPWIVGYYAKDAQSEFLAGVVDAESLSATYDIVLTEPFSSWKFNATTTPFKLAPSDVEYRIYGMNAAVPVLFGRYQGYIRFDKNGNNITPYKYLASLDTSLDFSNNATNAAIELEPVFQDKKDILYNYLSSYINITTEDDEDYFLSLQGKIVKDSEGKYYKIEILEGDEEESVVDVTAGNLFETFKSIINESSYIEGTPDSSSFKVSVVRTTYSMSAIELLDYQTTWDMTGSKLSTEDAPYNIFAIPCGDTVLKSLGATVTESDGSLALPLAMSIIKTMGSNLYDIQLLPYCPIRGFSYHIKEVHVNSLLAYSLVYGPPDSEGNKISYSYILNVPSAQFSKSIYHSLERGATIVDRKINNQCNKYRLCSPNFNGYFDFSVEKNKGVGYFNVDCIYKPFQPYIHINPIFKGLYGKNFEDPRGLICGGDFSLSQIKDQWQEYQIQNKNYQEIFNRDIQSLELQNKYQRIAEILGASIGTVQGAAAGGAIGNMIPGIGTATGALVGGVSSLAGGVGDLVINEKLRTEALDYRKDMFGYNLGNIQALPATLTKVSSLNNNNKIFPLLEIYTCTDREKDAFIKKLAYNGMTTMVIDKPSSYTNNYWEKELSDGSTITSKGYIKGSIIRLENLEDDFHLVKSISDEFFKGVYIQ